MTVGAIRTRDCYNQRLESILAGYSDKSWREKQNIVTRIEREFGWKLYQKALRVTGIREDAEDAVLHGLVVLVTQVANGHAVNRPWGLLSTVVKNYSINQAVRRSHQDIMETLDDEIADSNYRYDISGKLEARDLVAFALKQLSSEVDREIISLRGMYGFEFREIAEILLGKYGRSLGTRGVKARYDRARRKLRELLQEELTMNFRINPKPKRDAGVMTYSILAGITEPLLKGPDEQVAQLAIEIAGVNGRRITPVKAYSSIRVVCRAANLLGLGKDRLLIIKHERSQRGPCD